MLEHFQSLAIKLLAVRLLHSCERILLLLKLNVGESTAHSICETLQFTLLNVAELGVKVKNLLLGYGRGQVAHKDISLGIKLLVDNLQAYSDDFAIDFRIVEGFLARNCLLLRKQLDIAVVQGLVSLLVDDHDGFDTCEAFGLDELKEVQIVKLAWQIADMERG